MSRAFKVVLLRPDKYPVLSIPGTKFHAFKDRAFKDVPRAGRAFKEFENHAFKDSYRLRMPLF